MRKLFEADFMPLYEQKLSDGQIAEQLGVARITVGVFRRSLGLPAVATGGGAHYKPSAAAAAAAPKPKPAPKRQRQDPIALENSGLGDWPNAPRVKKQPDALYAWRIGLIKDAAQKFYGPRQTNQPTGDPTHA